MINQDQKRNSASTDLRKKQQTPTTVLVDKHLKTPEGLIVPAIFKDCNYVDENGYIIPAFIIPDSSEPPCEKHGEKIQSPTAVEIFNMSNENSSSPGIHPSHALRTTPHAQQFSVISLKEKLENAQSCNLNMVNSVNYSMLNFSTDDSGNADRFFNKYGDILRYNYDTCIFLLWNGLVWESANTLIVKNMCETAMKSYRKAATHYQNSRNFEESEIYVHSCASCNNSRLNALVEILKERFAVSNEIFDSHNHLLTVRNGVVDLRTGELFPHNKNLFLTTYCDVDFLPNSFLHNSVFSTFISTICCGNVELMNCLQLCFGYAITGETKEQKLFLLHGEGSNGKTTFIEAISGVISSYAKHIPIEVLTGLSDNRSGAKPSPELAQTPNVRMLLTSEPNAGSCLNEGLVKLLTGGGKISVRQLYGAPFEFEPKFKIFLDTNHLPSVSGEQFAMQRRLCVLPFNATFKGPAVDHSLPEKLKSQREKEVILAWLIKGAVRYYHEGLNVPPMIANVTSEYIRLNDSFSLFFTECVEKQDGAICFASHIFSAYLNFCNENGLKPLTQTRFGRNLVNNGIEKCRNSHGIFYKDICVI